MSNLTIKKISLGKKKFNVINLTKPLTLDQEVYPGDPKPVRKIFTDIDDTGWHHYIHELADHHFQPHADAPNHQNPELKDRGIEAFDMDFFFNQAFLIDLSTDKNSVNINGINFIIEVSKKHFEPYKKYLEQKSAVLIRTGYDKWLEKNLPHKPELLPYLTKDAAEFIASFKNIKVVGTDSITVDPPESHTAHKLLKDKLIVESLVNLHNIPKENAMEFDLETSPVKIVGATGAPVIAYAFIEV
jgi:kynurenine formamidase